MRIAYLDCFSGISGDMFLGALVDAGVSPKLLEETVAALDIGAHLDISRVTRGGISAAKVDVFAHGEKDMPRELFWEHKADAHSHSHSHSHTHDHVNRHASEQASTKTQLQSRDAATIRHQHGRHLKEIVAMIEKAQISGRATSTAIRIFEALGQAEAEVHSTTIEKVHFHEVGAVDAMVDIVCAAVGSDAFDIDEWACSPLNVGSGTVKCAHGTLPVPAPATLRLLQDAPVYSSGPAVELVTPTGAAIVKTLVARFGSIPAMKVEKAGYGAGTRDFHEHPNLLRLTIGEAAGAALASETVTVLEANLDDLNPQVLAYASEKLLADGALDVFSLPAQMKKGRAGALLTVLCKPEAADRLTRLVFAETTTLGVRRRDEQRQTLTRRWETVRTSWGDVRIKIASMNGSISNYAPEYEDCRMLAETNHVPLKLVIEEAVRAYASGNRK
ncbi:MAG TPA: nickel pincer cofactor biosynthesis protein LarC [Terriglobales bacterium]|nr:nickel pincer cofactor biosynthesis protein LarC [Terriglobales bacterium]